MSHLYGQIVDTNDGITIYCYKAINEVLSLAWGSSFRNDGRLKKTNNSSYHIQICMNNHNDSS